jgi:hypothetical protein
MKLTVTRLTEDTIDSLWAMSLECKPTSGVFRSLPEFAIETEDLNLSIMVCLKFGWTIVFLSMLTVRSWWSQWGVMAVHHCYSWWRWWSRMLWVMLMRLWLESLSSCFLCVVFVSTATHRYVNMYHGTTLTRGEIPCSYSSLKTMLYTIIWRLRVLHHGSLQMHTMYWQLLEIWAAPNFQS